MGNGSEISLHLFTYFARLSDRLFGTRLRVYGWALYFGSVPTPQTPVSGPMSASAAAPARRRNGCTT